MHTNSPLLCKHANRLLYFLKKYFFLTRLLQCGDFTVVNILKKIKFLLLQSDQR